jgi:hypothetical protein
MNDEKADKSCELHHNCFSRGSKALAGEFFENSKLLKARKDGNYLYHEILSIDLKEGVERSHAKACLRELALRYVEQRCPRNMVYGTLHEDHKNHIHYHLLISANERESRKRFRVTKKEFDTIKHELETYVLTNYTELKQIPVATTTRQEKKLSRKASDQKRRTGKLERKEQVRDTILRAIETSATLESFKQNLLNQNYEFYTRGKNYGVAVSHDDGKIIKYRFSGLGIHESFEAFLAVRQTLAEAQSEVEVKKDNLQSSTNSDETEAAQSEAIHDTPEVSESDTPQQSQFLKDMAEKRQKKFAKKSRKGKPRTK